MPNTLTIQFILTLKYLYCFDLLKWHTEYTLMSMIWRYGRYTMFAVIQ